MLRGIHLARSAEVRIYPVLDVVGGPLVAATCVLASSAEAMRPLRPRASERRPRWLRNLAFGAVAALVVRGVVVPATQACARGAARRRFGLLRWLLPESRALLPSLVRAAASVLALDYSMYLWHRALHSVRPLWRFHAVHHADRDLDASTALRFHAGELALSVPFRCLQTVVLGPSPQLALGYEVAMQVAALLHHSNVRLPATMDAALSNVFVTPRLHGVHHSVETPELQSNWSVIFSFWDRLHGTRRTRADQPTIGLAAENAPPGVAATA